MVRRELTARNEREWLANRRCGASDVAKIVGLSPYGGPWDAWLSATGQNTRTSTGAMTRGHIFEPVVLYLYAQQTENGVERPRKHSAFLGPEAWASASPDAFARAEVEEGLVEAKTDMHGESLWGQPCVIERWDDIADAVERGVPLVRPDYALQACWQMWVLDAPWVDLAVLLPRYELRVFRVMRDPDFELDLVDQVREWWQRHVIPRVPPPVDDKSSKAYRSWFARQRASSDEYRVVDENMLLTMQAFQVANDHAKASKAEADRIGDFLLSHIGGGRGIKVPSGPEATVVRNPGRDVLNVNSLLEERPDLAELVRKHTRPGAPFIYPKVNLNAKNTRRAK